MSETVNNPAPVWKTSPKTLSAAIGRIEDLQQHAYWLQDEISGCRMWGEHNAAEAQRLGRLLVYRAKVGNANAICSHAHTEVGAISRNTYCSDCQETLITRDEHLAPASEEEAR